MAPVGTSGYRANYPTASRGIRSYCRHCAPRSVVTRKGDQLSGCHSAAFAYIVSAATRLTLQPHAQASLGTISSSCVPAAATTPPPPSPPLDLLLSNIRVVLVAPKHEANVGAVARACANFECLSLFLVAPRCSITTGGTGAGASEARKVSCGDTVLDRIVVTDTLAEALADTTGSIGFTRRAGATRVTHASLSHLLAEFPWALALHTPPPLRSPLTDASAFSATVAAKDLPVFSAPSPPPNRLGQPALRQMDPTSPSPEREGDGLADASCSGERHPFATALVFGREESGLTETELRLCSHACAIPTGRLQPSMNLSHAVAVVLAELFSRRCGLMKIASPAEVAQAAVGIDGDSCGDRNGEEQLLRLQTVPTGTDHEAQLLTWSNSGVRSAGGVQVTASQAWSCMTASSTSETSADNVGAAAASVPSDGRDISSSGGRLLDASLLPASAQEVDLLVQKVAAVAEAVGMRGKEGIGGGGSGNHGRRRLPVGHLRSVVSRARINAAESRSLHGLASAVLQRLDPDNPLEARKLQRKQQQAQQPKVQGHQQAHQHNQQVHQAQ
ncbi:hypothetical protein Vretimale_1925 [Volvox reticuliferus]|uniref:tRNA/rRNA methyltransferase SpoU type domain-containing protein n=1 Tax=Volvox reticuliferus TaxID=1737510 RepID=A0A8J4G2E8_9CHLO|nr:hypothetical protein Vretifemale_17301 [Volvox reticuliferus]GIL96020.1 hypothetical protein Vretimale_1925 [Volvox reticuliferus]